MTSVFLALVLPVIMRAALARLSKSSNEFDEV